MSTLEQFVIIVLFDNKVFLLERFVLYILLKSPIQVLTIGFRNLDWHIVLKIFDFNLSKI